MSAHRRPLLQVDTSKVKTSSSFEFASSVPFPGDARGRFDHYHTSVFRSYQMEIQVHSPTVKVVRSRGYEPARSLPVFSDQDRVEGVVRLDPHLYLSPGQLVVSMEGAFIYVSPDVVEAHEDLPVGKARGQYRHLFFTSSVTYTTGDSGSPRSASSIREAFANTVRTLKVDRKASLPDLRPNASRSHFPFSFDIPRPARLGEELPPTCASVSVGVIGIRGRTGVERAEVEYRIIARWEGTDPNQSTQLEAPILLQPEADFQSQDGSLEPESWLEIPLHSDRAIPFKCAVTLPDPSTFARSTSIPFFVIFKTKPYSHSLAREIAADATVAVSLLRQVTVLSRPSLTYSPVTSVSSSEDSDVPQTPQTPKKRLLHRVVKSTNSFPNGLPGSLSETGRRGQLAALPVDKPLPPVPSGVSDMRTLQTDVSIGFPKRPRRRAASHDRHPSLEAASSLPDGLYKSKLRLEKNMLPSLEWAGLSVKYFVEVSVLFGQDELRARIPIRLLWTT
ncbi:hypothetical protein BC835DRAFT_245424 [Cytidiella melzeri]|nr:hypothetical protein BC835DRAFT_245424 [Cytidiella melzeri]